MIRNNKKEVLFFEKLRLVYLPYIIYHHFFKKTPIKAFNFDLNYHRSKIFQYLLNKKIVEVINYLPSSCCHKRAIDLTEALFRNSIINIHGLYHSSYEPVFKKNIVFSIYCYLEIFDFINSNSSRLVPDNRYLSGRSLYSKAGHPQIQHFTINSLTSYIFYFIENIKWKFFASIFLFLRTTLKTLKQKNQFNQRKFKYAFSLATPFQIKFDGKRSFDFLLDGKKITKENTLFVIEFPLPQDWINEKMKDGYSFLDTTSKIPSLKLAEALSCIKIIFRNLTDGHFDFNFTKSTLTIVDVNLRWRGYLQQTSFENYIYTSLESPSHLAKNALFKSINIPTWQYTLFVGGGVLYSEGNDFFKCCHILWSYQNPEHILLVNKDVQNYYKEHYFHTDHYHVVGSIFSSMIKEYVHELNRDKEIKQFFSEFNGDCNKLILFLDTTFVNEKLCPTTYEDGIKFYEDILWILDNYPEIYVKLKPSKREAFYMSSTYAWSSVEVGTKLMEIIKKVSSHPRVYNLGENGNYIKAAALSDLVITHCLSSPTVEALGAEIDSIWYESNHKHERVLYSNIPGLILHGRDQLQEKIQNILNNETIFDSENTKRQIKERLTTNYEGDALSQLRNLLH